jgi:hypothetical protein
MDPVTLTRLTITKAVRAGSTQPKLKLLRGIHLPTSFKGSPNPILPIKSGMLNKTVTSTTVLNTEEGAHFSGSTFNKIRTMVMG